MNIRSCTTLSIYLSCLLFSTAATADDKLDATRLVYREVEQGVDPYVVRYTVTSAFIRVDEEQDNSGHIIYDIKENTIHSISHQDRSILVIREHKAEDFDPPFLVDTEYGLIEDAPAISGKQAYNYVVRAITGVESEMCMSIQLVPGLLPEVTESLHAFQRALSAQHAANLRKTPDEFRTPCYLVDQVYNQGDYYSKGLPIQEWHSNERQRQLVNFESVKVDASIFEIPAEYRQFSLE